MWKRDTNFFLQGIAPAKDSAILCEQLGNEGGFLGNSVSLTVWGSNQSSDGWSILESLTAVPLFRGAVVLAVQKEGKMQRM